MKKILYLLGILVFVPVVAIAIGAGPEVVNWDGTPNPDTQTVTAVNIWEAGLNLSSSTTGQSADTCYCRQEYIPVRIVDPDLVSVRVAVSWSSGGGEEFGFGIYSVDGQTQYFGCSGLSSFNAGHPRTCADASTTQIEPGMYTVCHAWDSDDDLSTKPQFNEAENGNSASSMLADIDNTCANAVMPATQTFSYAVDTGADWAIGFSLEDTP